MREEAHKVRTGSNSNRWRGVGSKAAGMIGGDKDDRPAWTRDGRIKPEPQACYVCSRPGRLNERGEDDNRSDRLRECQGLA